MISYTHKGHEIKIYKGKGHGRVALKDGYIVNVDGNELWIFATIKEARAHVDRWFNS